MQDTFDNLFQGAVMLLDWGREFLPQIAWVGIPSALTLSVAVPLLG